MQHHSSCFANQRTFNGLRVCRHNFPVESSLSTRYTHDEPIKTRRLIGSEYLNGFTPSLFEKLKCNTSITFICNHNVHYVAKYPAKIQKKIWSKALYDKLTKCFQRSIENRERFEANHPDRTVEQNGCGRLHSLAHAATNVQEVRLHVSSIIFLFPFTIFLVCQLEWRAFCVVIYNKTTTANRDVA